MVLRLLTVCSLLVALAATSVLDNIKRRRDIEEDCPLCDYVYEDDGMFSYFIMSVEPQDGFTTYFLNMTSQRWLDESWTDWPVWWHYMAVHVPDGPRTVENAGFLYSSYRSNTNSPPDIDSDHVQETGDMCQKHGIVTAVVQQIPNQPIVFTDDPQQQSRSEDNMIAYTWRTFVDDVHNESIQEDPRTLARNPMCKGAVKAMDAITMLVNDIDGTTIDEFVIAGESKRGWTTWITGAIDSRVVGMIPVVLSCLNMRENFHHYYQSYGGWPYYLWDYWNKELMADIDTPGMTAMMEVIDPYTYRDWMTMPKLIVSGSSDEFFMPDDSHYFFDDLPAEKYLWMLEDTGHSIGSSPLNAEYWEMLGTFTMSIFQDQSRPSDISWVRSVDDLRRTGTITFSSPTEQPLAIEAYWADTVVDYRRDWRKSMLNYSLAEPPPDGQLPSEKDTGIEWTMEPVQDNGNGTYEITMDFPNAGYRAFFIKTIYAGPAEDDYYFTTETHIIPETFPYDRCSTPDECQGWLW